MPDLRITKDSKDNPHYKSLIESDFLGQWDIPSGKEPVVVIESLAPYIPRRRKKVRVDGQLRDEPIKRYRIKFVGKRKEWLAGPVSLQTLAAMFGPKIRDWCGQKITLYVDPNVMFGKTKTGGVRVRNTKPTEDPTEDPLDMAPDEEAAQRIAEAMAEFDDEG